MTEQFSQTEYPGGFDQAVRFFRRWDDDPEAYERYGTHNGGEVIVGALVANGYEPDHAEHIVTVARNYTINPMTYYPTAQQ